MRNSFSPPKLVLYIQYSNPGAYPPVQHSSRILGRAGWDVLFLGVDFAATRELRCETENNIQVKLFKGCHPGVRQKLHFVIFCLWALWIAIQWRPSWIYVSDSLASPIGWFLTKLGSWRVIYHEHDSPAELHIARSERSLFMRAITQMRRKLARSAELCVLPNEERIRQFQRETETARPVFCVWNCPSLDESDIQITNKSSDELVVFFHGSITPERLPLPVLHALALCPRAICLHFAGYETDHHGYAQRILSEARRLNISDRVHFLGALPGRRELLTGCARAHVGLSLMPMKSDDLNMVAMVGASNKAFDYLLCGLALLVSDLPDWNATYVAPGFGLACNPEDASSIARALNSFFENPADSSEMAKKGRTRVLKMWNYEVQFKPVLERMGSTARAVAIPPAQ